MARVTRGKLFLDAHVIDGVKDAPTIACHAYRSIHELCKAMTGYITQQRAANETAGLTRNRN